MQIDEFVSKAQMRDKTSLFSEYEGSLDMIPDELRDFYAKHNPRNVEIGHNGTSIHLVPAEKLETEKQYYEGMNIGFVFATCDSDPIFYHDGKIYTCPHGVKNPEWELLAESIEKYLDVLMCE